MFSRECRHVLVLLVITYGQALSDDSRLRKLQCLEECYGQGRRCLALPNVCGECAQDHVDVDGVCRARSMQVAERDPNIESAIKRELKRERRKLNLPTDDGTEDEVFVESRYQLHDPDADNIINAAVNDMNDQSNLDMKRDDQARSNNSDWIGHDVILIAVIAALCAAAVVGILVALICCCIMRRSVKDISDADYSSYKSSEKGEKRGYPPHPPIVDRKLAQSAQMYHYQHQKQQMLELERAQEMSEKSEGDGSSEDENGNDEYTVYECPGLANTGEMEVRNPLYTESPLPASSTSPPPRPSSTTTPPPLSSTNPPLPSSSTSSPLPPPPTSSSTPPPQYTSTEQMANGGP